MKKSLLLFFCILFIMNANAQTPILKWAKTFSGKNNASTDTTSVMKMYNLDKSIYILGTSNTYGTANDFVLIKRDYATGDTLWTRHYNGPANGDDQAVDMVINQTIGDIYIVGKSIGVGTAYDIVTIKYSSTGIFGWAKRWDNSSIHGNDIPKNIGIDVNGRIYVAAFTYNGSGYPTYYEDVLILVYNSAGSLTGRKEDINYMYRSNIVQGGIITQTGDVFVAAETVFGTLTNGYGMVYIGGFKSDLSSYYPTDGWGGITFNNLYHSNSLSSPDDFTYYNSMDIDNYNNLYIATLGDTISFIGTYYKIMFSKINNTGSTVWTKKIGGNTNSKNLRVNALKVDPNSLNIYAVGYEINNSGNFDWFVIKYNSGGVFQWRVNKDGTGNGNDIAYALAFDSQQNPIVAGNTRNSSGDDDITIVKYNKTDGTELFSKNYDSGNGDDKAYNILIDANQNIIINGVVNTATESQNMLTLQYCNPAAAAGTITGETTVCQGQNSVTYTVPAIDFATSYIWSLPTGATGTSTSNSISVDFSISAVSGNITVKGHNDCIDGAASSIAITVNETPSAPTVGTITQPTCSVATGSVVLSGLPSGDWTINPGAITGSTTSKTISGLAAGTYNFTVTNASGCISDASADVVIDAQPVTPTPAITQNGMILHSDAPTGNQWYNQAGIINGATGQEYTVTANGDYYVIVTLVCSSNASNIISIVNTGVDLGENNKSIKVYPNPVSKELIIELEGNKEIVNFEILNSVGQSVYKGNLYDKTNVKTEDFKPGLYFIKLDYGNSFKLIKIVKQ